VGPEQSQPSPLFNSGDTLILSTQPPYTPLPVTISDAMIPSKSDSNLTQLIGELIKKTIKNKGYLPLHW
jgi:hypothetical protein